MGQFYLGFFAAVTIETKDVWLDLNGFSIQQKKDFYVRQRWYTNIELSDRAFVANEGVASLKVQEGDKLLASHDGASPGDLGAKSHTLGAVGAGASASQVIISGGRLGLSSHAGIHGNGNTHIVVEDVTVDKFEVGDIQL